MLSNNFFQRNRQSLSRHFRFRQFIAIALLLLLPTALITARAAFRTTVVGDGPIDEARTLEVSERNWPKGVIELVEINGWKAVDFPRGLEVKIKNISGKPIYFYEMDLLFPEAKPFLSKPGVLHLYYGDRMRMMDIEKGKASAEDTPINPGEIVSLTPAENDLKNFYLFLGPEVRRQFMDLGLKRIEVISQVLNFGDGTGYEAKTPFPKKIAEASVSEEKTGLAHKMAINDDGSGNCVDAKSNDPFIAKGMTGIVPAKVMTLIPAMAVKHDLKRRMVVDAKISHS